MPGLRVRYIAPGSEYSEWLTDALRRTDTIDVEIVFSLPPEQQELDRGDDSDIREDVIVADSALGKARIARLIDVYVRRENSIPVLIALSPGDAPAYDSLVPLGAQDFLLRGEDSPQRIVRSLQFAVERNRMLFATLSAEARIRTIVEHLSEGVIIVDQTGQVLYANPATEEHLALSLDQLFGQTLPIEIPSTDYAASTIELSNGSTRYLAVHRVPIMWEGQEAILMSIRDMSAEHETREQMRRAKKDAEEMAAMKSSFFANMSHELRLPLASIIGFGQIIEEEIENDELREFARMIQDGGQRLLNTINSVLDVTRLEAVGFDINPEPVRASDVVIETVRMARSLARQKEIELDAEGDVDLVLSADPELLERVLTNLIGNAIKFTDEGQVMVTYERDDDMGRIDVADTGIGIDPEFLPRMFEEFTQESSGRNRTHGGSGLGLAISKRLIESMNGHIDVQSEKNKGTTMSVYLPLSIGLPTADYTPDPESSE